MSKEAMKDLIAELIGTVALHDTQAAQRLGQIAKAMLAEQPAQQCRTDGRCQYAIDSGAEGMGHCPKGKCVMPAQQEPYGQVTVVRRPGGVDQHWFYRWPERPYLDNAAECHTLYTSPPQRKPLTNEVCVPLEVLEAAESSLGSFCSDEGWSRRDMQNMDNLSAYIAQHKAAHNIKE